jgi:hypothetical protein
MKREALDEYFGTKHVARQSIFRVYQANGISLFDREVIYGFAHLTHQLVDFKTKSRAFIGCNNIISGGSQGYTIRQIK